MSIRNTAVAGIFYPEQPEDLRASLELLLQNAPAGEGRPKAIIVPHAGYQYSGPVAAAAYASIFRQKPPFSRVVLMGPAHRIPFHGIATSSADYFATPLGNVPVDHESLRNLIKQGLVKCFDPAHEHEHCLEVQLPFLQEITGQEFEIIPLLVGDTDSENVAEVLRALWGDSSTLIVISSDLSHYNDYASAKRLDKNTTQSIETLHGEQLNSSSACGFLPIQGLLKVAKEFGMECKTLDLRNSGDTAGPQDRVVGYGAYCFH